MKESNQQETSDAVDAKVIQTENTTDQTKPKPSKKAAPSEKALTKTVPKLVITTSFILSIIAFSASGWLYYQNLQNTSSQDITLLKEQHENQDKKISANTLNQAQLHSIIEQIKNSSAQADQQKLAIQQTQQSEKLLSLEAKLNRLNNTTKEDWKLAEAEYLIRLANQRLLLESDRHSAITLLSNADDILNDLEDPITFATRKALAKDIQALSALNPFDLEGAYLALNALYDNVPNLPQKEPSKQWQESSVLKKPEKETVAGTIESTIQDFWQSIRSLVVINYNQTPIKPLLPPAEYQELITGLQLQFDIAQVALIKGESVIFEQTLSRIAAAITEHFDTKSNSTVSFLAKLSTIQQLNPSPDLPLPRDSLIKVKSLVSDWHKRGVDESNTRLSIDNAEPLASEINTATTNNKGDNI